MINKVLGQEIADLEERRQYLLDNADSVVEMDYHKPFDACIRINDLEEDIKQYRDGVNEELKPIKTKRQELLEDIKAKGRMVKEKCFLFIEQEEKMACFYNAEGALVSSRPATREELKNPTLFQQIRKVS